MRKAEMLRVAISVVLVILLSIGAADAARLTSINGQVFVNRGQGAVLVVGDVDVGPGDRIKVDDGSADLVYENCTTVHLGAGDMVAVLANPPCTTPAKAAPGGFSTETYVIGGLVILGAAGAGVALAEISHPASP